MLRHDHEGPDGVAVRRSRSLQRLDEPRPGSIARQERLPPETGERQKSGIAGGVEAF